MKINFKLTLLFAAIITFNACSKSSNPNPTNNTIDNQQNPGISAKYLIKEVSVVQSSIQTIPSGTFTTNYLYDSKKRLLSIAKDSILTSFSYNEDGNLAATTATQKSFGDVYKFDTELSYSSGKLSSATQKNYINNTAIGTNTYSFVTTGNNISEVIVNGVNGSHDVHYYYDNNNNVIKSDYGSFTYEYIYDNHKSPYTNIPQTLKNVFVDNGDLVFSNNVVTKKQDGSVIITYALNYDTDGYLSTSISDSGKVKITTTYTYSGL